MHYTFYGDDTQSTKNQSATIPDTRLFGGIIIERSQEQKLLKLIEHIKSEYGCMMLPIKWNIQDVEKHYFKAGKMDDYNRLLKESGTWRKEILEHSLSVDYKIVLAAIQCFQPTRDSILKYQDLISSSVFTNVLQRVGMEAKENKCKSIQVVLDWPDQKESTPFCNEYSSAYYSGKSVMNHSYTCGALRKLGFYEAPLFARTYTNSMLQFTDLVVGATKDFLKTVHKGSKPKIGYYSTRIIREKFRGYPDNLFTRGLVIKPSNINDIAVIEQALLQDVNNSMAA